MGSYFRSDRAALKSSFYNSEKFDALVDAAEQKGSREEAHGDPGHQEHEQDTDDAA